MNEPMTQTQEKPQPPLIYQRMAEVISDVGAIGKNQKNQHQGFKFRGIDDLYNACHSAFAKHQVFSTQEVVSHDVKEGKTRNGSVNFHHKVLLRIRFHTIDGSFVESILWGESMDTQDKGMNKAYSIAMKYALIQALMIPTEDLEDPDAHTTELAAGNQTATKPPQTATKPRQQATKPRQQATKPPQGATKPETEPDLGDLDPAGITAAQDLHLKSKRAKEEGSVKEPLENAEPVETVQDDESWKDDNVPF